MAVVKVACLPAVATVAPSIAPQAVQPPTGGAPPVVPTQVAGTATPGRADNLHIALGVGLLIAGIVAASTLNPHAAKFEPKPGFSVFAVFYVFAQALERVFELLQLLWPSLGKTDGTTKEQAVVARDTKLAASINTPTPQNAQATATAQATVDTIRANRALLAWTLISGLAMAGAAALGLQLIAAISSTSPPLKLDYIITGLIVGGGSKPLHDLIANLQESKKQSTDPKETSGQ